MPLSIEKTTGLVFQSNGRIPADCRLIINAYDHPMNESNEIPYESLWKFVTENFHVGGFSIHGPSHWKRVERNGLLLADSLPNVDRDVIRLFALFHDSKRENDGYDPGHGSRGADFAESLLGQTFDGHEFRLRPQQCDNLLEACRLHTDQTHHEIETIGCCFDADRLDLPRVGMRTDAAYLNTQLGKEIANGGGMEKWLATYRRNQR